MFHSDPSDQASKAMFRESKILLVMSVLGFLLCALPASAYVVVLKNGSQINTQKPPERQGDQVLLIMQSGVRTSYPAADIDFKKTEEINAEANYGSARVLDKVKEVDTGEDAPEEKRPQLSDLLAQQRRAAAAAAAAEAAAEAAAVDEAALGAAEEVIPEADANLPKTSGGYVDLGVVRRGQADNLALVGEINTYLTGQGGTAKVFDGTRPNWLLLEMQAASEASVFKAMKDAASCLIQVRQAHPTLEGFELYIMTGSQVRGGQFTMTPERANLLLTGKLEAPAFFLRYVEF